MVGSPLSGSFIFSFPPIEDKNCNQLILGTMPGKESLRLNEYYAHPQNGFWKMIFALHNLPFSTDYDLKRKVLLDNHIALWDVLKYCHRASSLDSDIQNEEPNDLRLFLDSHPKISRLFFNGQGAARYFRKYFPDIDLPWFILPSTSPAHAVKPELKLERWNILKNLSIK